MTTTNALGVMSVDESLIEKESPPTYVTQRRGNVPSGVTCEYMEQFENKILSTLESWFTKYDEKISKITSDLDELKKSFQFMSDRYEELDRKTSETQQRVSILEDRINSTQPQQNQRVSDLESKIDAMEQQARSCNMEISNLPEKSGENLLAILEEMGSILKNPVSKQDVISIHRVPHADSKSSRPKNVIVKFATRLLRDNFVASVRLARGMKTDQLKIWPSQNIYVNEHLTLKNKGLFRQAREAAKNCGYTYVWIKHGNILVRANDTSSVIAIRSNSDLSKIKVQQKS